VIEALGIYGGTLVTCFVAGIVQVINTEAVLLGVSLWLVDSPTQLPLVALCAATGQMAANVGFFYAGRGGARVPRLRAKLDAVRAKIATWQKRPTLVLIAAAIVGLPPLVLVAVAAGALGIGIRRFAVIGLLGRVLRFGAILAIPWL
jgi:membrane protein YqaA with SNARE-associated domain